MDPIARLRAEFEAAVQELRKENAFIKDQLIAQQSKSIDHSPSNRRPKPCLPDPEKFAGQSLKFDTWLPSIKAKLKIDGEAIGDATAQFYYVYLNLDSNVQAMVLPQLHHAEETGVWNFNTILEQLERVYNNPNKIHKAEDKLLGLKQGDDALPAFIAKFEWVLYEARGQTWPDATKISALRRGLSLTIKNRLAQQLNLPTDYPGFLRVVQQLAGHSFSSAVNTSGASNSYSNSPKPTPRYPDSMDVSAINVISSISTGKNYREEGCCFRCGSNEHFVRECPRPAPDRGGVSLSSINSRSTNEKTLWNVGMLKALEARSDTSLDEMD